MTAFTNFELDDIVEGNVAKNVTSTLFSGGASSLTSFFTSSAQTASAAGTYYWDVYDKVTTDASAEVQFQISYGHYAGSGSATPSGATTGIQPTRAVYSQFRNILVANPTPTTKFSMTDNHNCDRMIFFTFNRARFKEQVDVGNWELRLSGSAAAGNPFTSGQYLGLIDDSTVSSGTTENGHKVYNIVSGSGTTLYETGSAYEYYGKVYPELGILALNGDRILSSSTGNTYEGTSSLKLTGGDSADAYDEVNEKIFLSINSGSYFSGRADEDVSSTHYFVRAKNSKYNFTSNDTFTTGSAGQVRHTSMIGDPQVYITTIGLYSDTNELVAVAKLSKPLLKNFEREATVRVKLDY